MNTIQQGWQCPKCLVIYAPSVMKCECCKVMAQTVVTVRSQEELIRELEKLSEGDAPPAERPFYPPQPYTQPPYAPYLDPSTHPMSFVGETPQEKRFTTLGSDMFTGQFEPL